MISGRMWCEWGVKKKVVVELRVLSKFWCGICHEDHGQQQRSRQNRGRQ
jgi:hypothetical protein